MSRRTALVTIIMLMLATAVALPHSGATGVVKQRMDMMEAIAGRMKTVAAMIRGKRPFDANDAAAAAETIAAHARKLPQMFPEDSAGGSSEASAHIWVNWEQFVKLSRRMQMKALSLAETAAATADGVDLRPQFRELGQTCIACHEVFRENR